ncbi:hypothetical protein HKX48_003491 [Thoreauomyces humboldtii]|nr:hypothetical protein HKX48_003491 [Thoreauomyces humboldtii]
MPTAWTEEEDGALRYALACNHTLKTIHETMEKVFGKGRTPNAVNKRYTSAKFLNGKEAFHQEANAPTRPKRKKVKTKHEEDSVKEEE